MAADSPGGYDEWAISLLFVIFLCITLLWKALLHTVEGALRASPGELTCACVALDRCELSVNGCLLLFVAV